MHSSIFANEEDERFSPMSEVERVGRILACHTETPDGYCLGCKNEFGFAVIYPCSQVDWADRTLALEKTKPARPCWFDEDTQEVQAPTSRNREVGSQHRRKAEGR